MSATTVSVARAQQGARVKRVRRNVQQSSVTRVPRSSLVVGASRKGLQLSYSSRVSSSRGVLRCVAEDAKSITEDAENPVAVGSVVNPGDATVAVDLDTSRRPDGEKKTVIITGASSGLGLHTAKVLAKTGNYHVICCVRNEAKMHDVAEKLGMDKDCYSVKECNLMSLRSVRDFCDWVVESGVGLDCVVCNAAIYYPKRKDPSKVRVGFHMAGAAATGIEGNQMAEDATETAEGFEEQMGVNHLSHFLMANLLLEPMKRYGEVHGVTPRMIIVGSITHNPTELAGKIPPQANLGAFEGFRAGFQVKDGITMADGGKYDGPKAYKDSKACNMLSVFEMHRRYHKSHNIIFNTMYPGCIAETPLFRNHYPAFQRLFPAFMKYVTGGYVSVEEAGERLAAVCADREYEEESGAYWSWLGGLRGAAGASNPKNRTEKGLGGKFVNRVSKEVADEVLAKEMWKYSCDLVGIKDDIEDLRAKDGERAVSA